MNIAVLRPEDIADAKAVQLPAPVLKAWNDLIAQKFSGASAIIKQSEAVAAIVTAMNCHPMTVHEAGWLEIETLYRQAGWRVDYDKPAYNESYEPYFTFRKWKRVR